MEVVVDIYGGLGKQGICYFYHKKLLKDLCVPGSTDKPVELSQCRITMSNKGIINATHRILISF